MHYAQMRKFDIANGIGIRTTLFVSGCTHRCPNCFNQDYQAFDYGKIWDQTAEDTFMSYVKDANVHGVTILGGEPMEQTQDEDLYNLFKRIKTETNQTIWVYSGYTFEAILKDEKKRRLLEWCDVLVDGPFIESLKDIKLKFRGSSNQTIIDVKASLVQGKKVLLDIE
ncbi:anaerobic ribonucleoside-triphosphate reductase activating protein [Niameybacter massiliensis]|uniref:Anaerobic ribonucleoside-triphosphate reductase-activating protein n=1 Tax=Holtiella tumoricola TaxID=3018743 RepID=A0AA42J1X3_9FIRM|nr:MULTISPECIES: anaerobic ribonucleoside-triphosphate reductase activating protein [Lachnospirales]MDA3732528.1 anaerobic ribonucleoside-triphosphate reductase activating protein [Holtiella tumoricola]